MYKPFRDLAEAHSYTVRRLGRRFTFSNRYSHFYVNIELMGDSSAFIYVVARTTSWQYDGERTDLHDVLSLLFASLLRAVNVSCALWKMANPAADLPSEFYGRYITFSQPQDSNIQLDPNGIKVLHRIFIDITNAERATFGLFQSDRSQPAYHWDDSPTRGWAQAVALLLGDDLDKDDLQYNTRGGPSWRHYRSARCETSVIESDRLTAELRAILNRRSAQTTIAGVEGVACVSGDVRNVLPHNATQVATKVLNGLADPQAATPIFHPLENHLLVLGSRHIVSIQCESGAKGFAQEKESLRALRQKQDQIFFETDTFEWADHLDDGRFEELIRSLLVAEPGVRRVRKIGQTREPDDGRDLICEWLTPPLPHELIPEPYPPLVLRRVVVQCKALAKSVGKSDVQDVHDTVMWHECNGFFLAAASQITTPLIRFLEGMRKSIWTDWWTRVEIEDRLRKNPEILNRFVDLVVRRIA